MSLPIDSVSDFIRTQHPNGFCASCIAKRLNLSEKDVREALQVVAVQRGFRFRLRTCRGCRRTAEVVEVQVIQPQHAEGLHRAAGDEHSGTAPEEPRDRPNLVCRLCGHLITAIDDMSTSDAGVAHVLCIEGYSVDPLAPDERSRLIRICWNHEVAVCPGCSRTYRMNQLGTDVFSDRYHLCPFCGVDLSLSIRQHIADCSVIRLNDPWWQADTREALTRAHQTRKNSRQLRDASELTRIVSEVLRDRVQDTTESARQAQLETERIKREPPREGE